MKTYGNKKGPKSKGPIKVYGKENMATAPTYPSPAVELANKKQHEIKEKALAEKRKKDMLNMKAAHSFARAPLPPIPTKRKLCLEDIGIY